jgi:hypothetical protein
MERRRHSETVVAQDRGQRNKLAALLESLRRSAVVLEASIEDEERRTGNHDSAHYAYPIVARTLSQRRDNLKATIAVLEQRLGITAT